MEEYKRLKNLYFELKSKSSQQGGSSKLYQYNELDDLPKTLVGFSEVLSFEAYR